MESATERMILKEVRETRLIAEKALYALAGREWTRKFLDGLDQEVESRRLLADAGLYKLDLDWNARRALQKIDVLTVEDVAAKTREEIAAVRGVGPATVARLDVELGERGLSYAEAV